MVMVQILVILVCILYASLGEVVEQHLKCCMLYKIMIVDAYDNSNVVYSIMT